MTKGRLEAFTDGVIAIIITIMVLEIKAPQSADFAALQAGLPIFLAYALSYLNVGIFWNNHHHMLHATEHIDGRVLWCNLVLLFWLSLVPFVIRWIDEAGIAPLPIAAYGVVLAMAAIGYTLLQRRSSPPTGAPRARDCARPRPQGEAVARELHRGGAARVRQSVDCDRAVRRRRADLARARPSHRSVARAVGD